MGNYFNIIIEDSFDKSLNYNLYFYEQNFHNFYSKIVKQTYASLNILKSFPYIYPIFFKTSENQYRRIILNNYFIIVYFIESKTVHVVYFFDGRKNLFSNLY